MKNNKIVWLLVSMFTSLLSVIVALNLPPSFGKTQFIVGVDAQQLKREVTKHNNQRPISSFVNENGKIAAVFFTPDDDVAQLLLDLIKQEQKSIHMAAFMLTHKKIAQALIEAHKRGVRVEIVTDQGCLKSMSGKAALLHEAGILVYVYVGVASNANMSNIMHNKFIVFGDNAITKTPLLVTGSANFTHSAQKFNQENVVLLNDRHLIEQFLHRFDVLKQRCVRCDKVQGIKNRHVAHGVKKRRALAKNRKRITNEILV